MKKTKVEPLVNLNVNPCKMCMPMGSVSAFYGIKKSMSILHGSQGCATYIRRHMATHYNEPVDIASSSLTEEGTVYGGEKNLIKGIKNLIEVYGPEVIGVSTTCLAETIGEDLPRIIDNFYEEYPEHKNVEIIDVSSPGYGGTQFEGYFRALYSIVSKIEMKDSKTKGDHINVITSPISPADTRFLKETFEQYDMDVILLPDISDNLDGVYTDKYEKLPKHGTALDDIKRMSQAKLTIEICSTDITYSPGVYLEDNYDVPLLRINLPVGLRDTDQFFKHLNIISGKEMPEKIVKERGRHLDGMIDAHKYCSEGRAVIFGEPDFVYSTVRLCVETGVMPLVVATGSVCKDLKERVEKEIEIVSKKYLVDNYEILDDVDFKVIEEKAEKLGANIMIGNSDGRRIEENLSIPLVRRSFPIHDRVGGQRMKTLGYEGSTGFMEDVANELLGKKEKEFREKVYDKYFEKKEEIKASIEEKTKNHPCFNGCGGKTARMHLPVAPKCNIQCNYCVRKFDCPNESRPGVTTKVLTPMEAFEKYKEVKSKVENLTVVGIAGPGDALANFDETKKVLELIREYDKDVTFCLSTNGLMLPKYAQELVDLGVSHVTVTMNAVDIKIGAKIYKHINYEGQKFTGESAAAILLSNQLSGLRMLVSQGIICKVNIVTLKGVNDHHIKDVVKTAKEIGCFVTNIMPFIKVEGSVFENLDVPSNKEILKLRNECSEIMNQMYHCKQCRADAIGTLDNDRSLEFSGKNKEKAPENDNEYTFAVASKSGINVDSHFGQVNEFYIYNYKKGEAVYKTKRKIKQYCQGSEECDGKKDKITTILDEIDDCNGVIVMRIGEEPKRKLKESGKKVFVTYNKIEDAVKEFAEKIN